MEDMHIHLKAGVTDISIMRKYLDRCKKLHIDKVLFLDHGNRISEKHIPVLNNLEIIQQFSKNIETVRKEYPDIDIKMGIESDFSYDEEFTEKETYLTKNSNFDIVIGSVHGMSKADYKDYLQANIDMINTYKFNVLGHLKLRKEYEEYKPTIEKIVKLATEKGIIFDLNTSDRSRWNLEQLEYMLNLFEKYGTKYNIGSDAHCIEEIGYEVKETYTKIDKIINHAERDIEYSIVSRGTEKYGSKGYMGVTKEHDGKKLFVLAKHGDKYIDTLKDSFEILPKYSIENIAISRFELMSALALKPILNLIKEKILIIGFGNLGFTNLRYLLKQGYKDISILTRNIKAFQIDGLNKLNERFKANVKFVEEFKGYSTYIEATGSSDVIKSIMENIENTSTVILLGTPKEEKFLLSPLEISRKNLKIIGGHELNGHTQEERKKALNIILEENSRDNLRDFVNIYKDKEGLVQDILTTKNNFIEVIKYDI